MSSKYFILRKKDSDECIVGIQLRPIEQALNDYPFLAIFESHDEFPIVQGSETPGILMSKPIYPSHYDTLSNRNMYSTKDNSLNVESITFTPSRYAQFTLDDVGNLKISESSRVQSNILASAFPEDYSKDIAGIGNQYWSSTKPNRCIGTIKNNAWGTVVDAVYNTQYIKMIIENGGPTTSKFRTAYLQTGEDPNKTYYTLPGGSITYGNKPYFTQDYNARYARVNDSGVHIAARPGIPSSITTSEARDRAIRKYRKLVGINNTSGEQGSASALTIWNDIIRRHGSSIALKYKKANGDTNLDEVQKSFYYKTSDQRANYITVDPGSYKSSAQCVDKWEIVPVKQSWNGKWQIAADFEKPECPSGYFGTSCNIKCEPEFGCTNDMTESQIQQAIMDYKAAACNDPNGPDAGIRSKYCEYQEWNPKNRYDYVFERQAEFNNLFAQNQLEIDGIRETHTKSLNAIVGENDELRVEYEAAKAQYDAEFSTKNIEIDTKIAELNQLLVDYETKQNEIIDFEVAQINVANVAEIGVIDAEIAEIQEKITKAKKDQSDYEDRILDKRREILKLQSQTKDIVVEEQSFFDKLLDWFNNIFGETEKFDKLKKSKTKLTGVTKILYENFGIDIKKK